MSMNIIEQIKALPENGIVLPDGMAANVIKSDDLKALAESHERLLEAANNVLRDETEDGWRTQMRDLKAAIEQAEKLTK